MVSGSFTSSRAAGKPRTPMSRRSLGSYVSTVLRVADAGTVYWLPSMKVHLTTLGCPKNQVDSELMLGMLTEAGFPLAERAEDADCLIVNTCAFIDRARQADNRRDWATSAPPGYLYDAKTPRLLTARVPYAYVKIAECCDMGCTFCAIPQIRGNHRSRKLAD